MNAYEKLRDKACKDGADVIDYPFKSERIKGLYCDGTIAIRDNIDTTAEKSCILAEELGHYHTSTGDILEQSITENRKQELHARIWAYNELIGLNGIIRCYEHQCHSYSEMADFLDVTERFLSDALKYYKTKYGICVVHGQYVIYFEPTLSVMKKLDW